ncbi:Low temperature viability protein [Geopyxis carbonaria]|nr:Low temperature viability protein [Geopyxis carbonaria]
MAPANTTTTKKWIDKKAATTFQVRYRSQKDPLIHDETATDFVLTAVDAPNTKHGSSAGSFAPAPAEPTNAKIKTAAALEAELGIDAATVRSNEGEAAMHGVFFDDTKYDYMQHLRDMGTSSEAVFIEAPQEASKQRKGKGKNKMSLDDALRENADEVLAPKSTVIQLPRELLPSETEIPRTFQDQMDVPDALKGFQPDMDPRLREVLEALDDDAYVDDDEDVFGELAAGGEADAEEFEDAYFSDEDDEGWQSDATEKAPVAAPAAAPKVVSFDGGATVENATSKFDNPEWMREFGKFKKAQKKAARDGDGDTDSLADTMSFGGSSIISGSTSGVGTSKRRRRREKKAGPGTATSGYSMSSSALFRNEGLTLLDDRFDRLEEEYARESDSDEEEGGVKVETRKDFDAIMDEFLEGYNVVGGGGTNINKMRVRRGKYQTGLEQLDEVRRDLGKARISRRDRK